MEGTLLLKANLTEQLQRLIQQLKDITEMKNELEAREFEEARTDTVEQLQELNERMSKMMSGDITLVDDMSAMQMATQSAISTAFRTSEVKEMFAKREPEQLRQKLYQIERDCKLGQLEEAVARRQKVEVLSALRQVGEKLSATELQLIAEESKDAQPAGSQQGFLQISEQPGVGEKALDLASMDVESLKKT